ncbi:hypothetical protein AJ79_09965 [Helicocarpus griseus UAMH5409]|uniref:Carboxylic ester hydrolase n=1 Tax=Helicocarpus griseus UAMH5409 TaxID=1447875 RepID=A0A2B7WG65_9EURO|nr:hypothetical protein AJ79_09965 [Helicocarpus griseus UAMH5409]
MLPSLRRLGAAVLLLASTTTAQLQQVTNFGENPTNVQMYVYRPAQVSPNPAIIVAMHYCTGTAQAYYQGTQYARLADSKGFIVIYPDAPDSGGCWDVHSDQTLTHDAGGDSLGIASMVRYALQEYGADPEKVFMAGSSSGAMMTNVLAGAYPDLFKAGSSFSGVPYGCFQGPGMWNSACAQGQLTKSAQEWGDMVRAGYPGYDGPRPRLQMWHGSADTTLSYNNFAEANKQWSNVFGIEQTGEEANTPRPGYTKLIFGDGTQYEAYSAQGVGHNLPDFSVEAVEWFGL